MRTTEWMFTMIGSSAKGRRNAPIVRFGTENLKLWWWRTGITDCLLIWNAVNGVMRFWTRRITCNWNYELKVLRSNTILYWWEEICKTHSSDFLDWSLYAETTRWERMGIDGLKIALYSGLGDEKVYSQIGPDGRIGSIQWANRMHILTYLPSSLGDVEWKGQVSFRLLNLLLTQHTGELSSHSIRHPYQRTHRWLEAYQPEASIDASLLLRTPCTRLTGRSIKQYKQTDDRW